MKAFKKEQLELIAESINYTRSIGGMLSEKEDKLKAEVMQEFANELADKLQANSPNFDRQRFLEACGLEVEHEHRWLIADDGNEHCNICGLNKYN